LSGAGGAVDRFVSGWKFNGITTFSSGQWKSPGLAVDWIHIDWGSSRPDQVGNPYPANQTFQNWLDSSAYVAPGCPSLKVAGLNCILADGSEVNANQHRQGSAGRNSLQMPGLNNWDFTLLKDTRIKENLLVQFRAEFFNGWNHTQFGDADTGLGTTFGKISSTRVNPREVQFALKLIW
jgi:hypothetical protein